MLYSERHSAVESESNGMHQSHTVCGISHDKSCDFSFRAIFKTRAACLKIALHKPVTFFLALRPRKPKNCLFSVFVNAFWYTD